MRTSEPGKLLFPLLTIGGACLLTASLSLGLVFCSAPYAKAAALGQIRYHEDGFQRLALALTPGRYAMLQGLLAFGAFLGLGLSWWQYRSGQPFYTLRQEWLRAWNGLCKRWQGLSGKARAGSAGLVVLLAVVRACYVLTYPLSTDEVASHDYFVQQGPLAISSFYPIPNNHIFYNLLAWTLTGFGWPAWAVMRLPTLILGFAGTLASYALLARLTGWRLATAVTALVSLAPLWAYYGAVGRGYFLQLCLLQVALFAVVELLQPNSRYRLLSWTTFIITSLLGLYLVPSYAYPLLGLGLSLAGGLIMQRRWHALRELALATATIAVTSLVLYAPVVALSGWKPLVANRYVAARTAAQFWPSYRAVLYETATELFGPPLRLSGPAWLATAWLGAWAVRRWLPDGPHRTLALLVWLQLALPLVLMAAQRVYVPARALLYLPYCGVLLLALLFNRIPFPGRRYRFTSWLLLGAAIAAVSGYRLFRHQSQVQAARGEARQLETAFRWLQRQARSGPVRVWLNAPEHELFFAHYAQQKKGPPLVLYSRRGALPACGYDFAVLSHQASSAKASSWPYKPVYRDPRVTIYAAIR